METNLDALICFFIWDNFHDRLAIPSLPCSPSTLCDGRIVRNTKKFGLAFRNTTRKVDEEIYKSWKDQTLDRLEEASPAREEVTMAAACHRAKHRTEPGRIARAFEGTEVDLFPIPERLPDVRSHVLAAHHLWVPP